MGTMNPFLKYAAYILSAAASAELLAYFYSKYWTQRKNEICETFFLNEKSGCCWTIKKDCQNKYCMSRVIERVEQEIDSAKSIICIAMYMFTNQRFCDAIIRAKKRDVIVRVILDYSQRGATGSKLKDFENAGIAVRMNIDDVSLMHHKFCLIDVITNETFDSKNKHPFEGLLITGSLNWTNNGMNKNWENVTFQSGTIKTQFKQEFNRMWTDLGKRQSHVPANRSSR